jgi:pimeloyl-ACP methyl ester carboxylesterase
MNSPTQAPTPKGAGSASHAPHLPSGFTQIFKSQYVDTGELRLHVVIGGNGPPLLLVHGWPENWYAWRLLMPAVAENFTVIAVDQRGIGLSDKPKDGYDTGTLAGDLVAMMSALGHNRFAVVGHDTGFAISYALAADYPDKIDRVVLVEIPGPPMTSASPPVFVPAPVNNKLWHIPFLRAEDLPEQLVKGREDAFFGYEFAVQGGAVSNDAIKYYVHLVSETGALPGSFGFYRALDATLVQNEKRKAKKLTMPVLAIGGERSYGAHVGDAMKALAENVESVVVPGAGHWLAEEAPDAMLAALMPFLSPYREAARA